MQGEVSDLLRLRNRLPLSKTRWPSVHCSRCCRNPRGSKGNAERKSDQSWASQSVLPQMPSERNPGLVSHNHIHPRPAGDSGELSPRRVKSDWRHEWHAATGGRGCQGGCFVTRRWHSRWQEGGGMERKTPGSCGEANASSRFLGGGANCLSGNDLKEKRGPRVQFSRGRHALPSLTPRTHRVKGENGVPSNCSLTSMCTHTRAHT